MCIVCVLVWLVGHIFFLLSIRIKHKPLSGVQIANRYYAWHCTTTTENIQTLYSGSSQSQQTEMACHSSKWHTANTKQQNQPTPQNEMRSMYKTNRFAHKPHPKGN